MLTRLHHILEESCTRAPRRPAVTFRETTVDYETLWNRVRATGHGLKGIGVRPDDRVAIFLDKRIETVVATFSVSAAGGVLVPINPSLKPPQVRHILSDSGATVLVTSAQRWAQLSTHLDPDAELTDVVLVDGPADSPEGTIRVHSAEALESHPLLIGDTPRGVDTAVAAILYTSGSTGRPKGVVLSHRNLIVGALSVSTYLENTADDVILSLLPLSFDAGFSQLTTGLLVGAHVVLANYLLARDAVRLCAKHRVTGITCVPPLWMQLVEADWPEEAAAGVRYFANTGGRMPKNTLDQLRATFPGARPFLMYGLTEAFRSTYLDPSEVDRRPDSIGKAIPNAEILVLRADGTPCDAGEEGELVHRGPLVALGYWRDAERTAQRFRPIAGLTDGWGSPELAVWSGDTVVADEEGFLYFVGRSDDMIKTSGYRVSPAEIEEIAYSTGRVRDAVALGLPDERLGHRVVLVVSAPAGSKVDPSEVMEAMRQELPTFMVPAEVIVRDEIPRSPNGKFDRVLVKEELSR